MTYEDVLALLLAHPNELVELPIAQGILAKWRETIGFGPEFSFSLVGRKLLGCWAPRWDTGEPVLTRTEQAFVAWSGNGRP